LFLRDLLLSLSAPLLAVPASSLAGAWARRARVALDAETHAAISFALLLAWLQAGGMLLGAVGALRALPALAWILAGALAALLVARRIHLPAFRRAHALLLLPVAAYLLLATVPPWDRDELVYHLALPRQFALAGRAVRPDDNIFASLPLGWESAVSLLYALGARAEPLFNPRLLGAFTASATALATTGLARALGARSAWVAGAALLAVPTFVEFGASGYVEPYLVLLTTLSLVAVARVVQGESSWLLPGGALAGLAASVKYPGLTAVAFLTLALLADRRSTDETADQGFFAVPENVRRAARFAGLALLVGCPFYVRNAIQRHNPVFPLAFDLLGGLGWDPLRSEAYWGTLRDYGRAEGIAGELALPLRLFFARDMLHGFEGSVGPVVAAGAVAAALLVRRPSREDRSATRVAAFFAAAYFLFWAFTVRQARFFLPAVPPLLALLARAVDLSGARARTLGALVVATSLGWGAELYAGLWSRQLTTDWLTGALGRDALLTRLLPESYPALRELDALVPESGRVWLVWTRGYTYYLDRPYRLDSVFEGWRFEALLDSAADPMALRDALRAEGFTHVLIGRRFFLQGSNAELEPGRTARLRARFEAALAAGVLTEEKRWSALSLFRVGAQP
jgi:hypothetical protein